MIKLACTIAALLLTASVLPKTAPLPADLARAWDSYNQATMHKDTTTLSALVTDDYMLVNSDTSIQDKKSYLSDFAVAGFTLDPYTVERQVYRVQGTAALTGGVFHLGWTLDGKHQERTLRIAHFWVKRGGHWRIAYTQLTRIPDIAQRQGAASMPRSGCGQVCWLESSYPDAFRSIPG